MDDYIRNHFKSIGEEKLKKMMGNHVNELKKRKIILEEQIQKLDHQRCKFKKLVEGLEK